MFWIFLLRKSKKQSISLTYVAFNRASYSVLEKYGETYTLWLKKRFLTSLFKHAFAMASVQASAEFIWRIANFLVNAEVTID